MNKETKQNLTHAGLFIVTFITTTLAGSFFVTGRMWPYTDYSMSDFTSGMAYSIPFLLFLTCHEFGHYFTAKWHKVDTSLPYYIPLPPFPMLIGTMGALIRIKQMVKSTKQHFDIGISGPLAGFVVTVALLIYGFSTLPEKNEYVFQVHPDYAYFGDNYEQIVYDVDTFVLKTDMEAFLESDMENAPDTIWYGPTAAAESGLAIRLGESLLFSWLQSAFADPDRVPNPHELMHYPILFAGFLSLLFTALNLLPIGQLDGGHVLYGLLGPKIHKQVAPVIFLAFILFAGFGIITPYDRGEDLWFGSIWLSIIFYVFFLVVTLRGLRYSPTKTLMVALIIFAIQFGGPLLFPTFEGYTGWLFFAFILGRFLGVHHPVTPYQQELDLNRKILGWFAVIVFIICFSPRPLIVG